MIDLIPLKNCVGCHSCESVCSFDAIRMDLNNEGFLFPRFEKKKCTRCGACLKACPVLNEFCPERLPMPEAYAAWSTNDLVRKSSSSGGIFSELAQKILNNGGVVYGACFDGKFQLCHREVATEEDLPPLRGSKYLQSNLSGIFVKVCSQLKEGQQVLFVGTPCQVAGLNSFLMYDYPKLITCDLICHGVSPPGVFTRYIAELEENHQATVTKFIFRAKPRGWKDFFFEIQFDNGSRILEPFADNSYMKAFLANLNLRPSCYQCKHSRLPRVADITLGDFWGIWNYHPEWDIDKGISALLINSSKAHAFLTDHNFSLRQAELQWVIEGNPLLIGSAKAHKNRKKFFQLFLGGYSIETIMNICLPASTYFDKVLWSVKRRLKRILQ